MTTQTSMLCVIQRLTKSSQNGGALVIVPSKSSAILIFLAFFPVHNINKESELSSMNRSMSLAESDTLIRWWFAGESKSMRKLCVSGSNLNQKSSFLFGSGGGIQRFLSFSSMF